MTASTRIERSGPAIRAALEEHSPQECETFEAEFAERVNALTADPDTAKAFGLAGRQRCVDEFSWAKIAAEIAKRQTPDALEKALADAGVPQTR